MLFFALVVLLEGNLSQSLSEYYWNALTSQPANLNSSIDLSKYLNIPVQRSNRMIYRISQSDIDQAIKAGQQTELLSDQMDNLFNQTQRSNS